MQLSASRLQLEAKTAGCWQRILGVGWQRLQVVQLWSLDIGGGLVEAVCQQPAVGGGINRSLAEAVGEDLVAAGCQQPAVGGNNCRSLAEDQGEGLLPAVCQYLLVEVVTAV